MNMKTLRPVTVYEWYQPKDKPEDPMSIYMRREIGQGTFHAFGVDYKEFETGVGNYSVAIVEMLDGTIITPLASLIRFDDTPEQS